MTTYKPINPSIDSRNNISKGLILDLPMGEQSFSGPVKDVTNRKYDGVINGTLTSTNGLFGKCYDYPNALTDYIEIDSRFELDFSNPWTVSIWMHADSFGGGGFATPWQFKTSSSVGFILFINDNNVGYKSVSFGSASVFPNLQTVTAITSTIQNVWSNIVLTYNGGTASSASSYELFVNAVSRPTQVAGAFGAVSQTNWIGRGDSASTYFDGKIDSLFAWNRALREEEIVEIYENPHAVNRPRRPVISRVPVVGGSFAPYYYTKLLAGT